MKPEIAATYTTQNIAIQEFVITTTDILFDREN